jgi:hypothetical protein
MHHWLGRVRDASKLNLSKQARFDACNALELPALAAAGWQWTGSFIRLLSFLLSTAL